MALAVFLPLWQLSYLQELDLSSNGLTGSLAAEWGGMTALAHLDLSFNQISGAVSSVHCTHHVVP